MRWHEAQTDETVGEAGGDINGGGSARAPQTTGADAEAGRESAIAPHRRCKSIIASVNGSGASRGRPRIGCTAGSTTCTDNTQNADDGASTTAETSRSQAKGD